MAKSRANEQKLDTRPVDRMSLHNVMKSNRKVNRYIQWLHGMKVIVINWGGLRPVLQPAISALMGTRHMECESDMCCSAAEVSRGHSSGIGMS
jgi:hypothetical protein